MSTPVSFLPSHRALVPRASRKQLPAAEKERRQAE